ncbi:MAG: M20/M25/M40 family metallo-hydrolase [Egibacteraceae bacterium]
MRTTAGLTLLAFTLLATLAAGPVAFASGSVDSQALRDAVTVKGIREHQQALQAIADANGGTRFSSSPGYDASVGYVTERLRAAGYRVVEQPFEFPFFQQTAPPRLELKAPTSKTYEVETDFFTAAQSGSGDVTAPVEAIDLVLPPSATPSSTSGCEAADFAGFTAGGVALIQRGTCTLAQKAANAVEAGAAAVVLFNEGQPDRTDAFSGTLGEPGIAIPVVITSFAVGQELATTAGAVVRVFTSTLSETRGTVNVLADTPGGREDRTVVVGAHLDSVPEGPGLNDNGSGTAVILEIAEQIDALGIEPANRIRFAFWGAEEFGLVGSGFYVSQLSEREIAGTAVNLNFDMLGSPNHVRFVYDGDGSDTPDAGPDGSQRVEQALVDYFAEQGLATEPTAFDGRSDYGPFIEVGIPAGGLFSGAEGIKTDEQAAVYGGASGAAYDPCYHQACDTADNVSLHALDELGDAAAHAVLTFAQTTPPSTAPTVRRTRPRPYAAVADRGRSVGQCEAG